MNEDPTRYWFPAKRYGWGWGAPRNWQGWAVVAAYAAAMAVLAIVFAADDRPFEFLVGSAIATAAFVAVCWLKGEPPRWRWGGK